MKKLILSIIAVVILASCGFAQEEFSMGSPYSAFGIGELRYSSSVRTDQMGVQGISLFGNYINALNPAANTYLKNAYFSLGMKVQFLKSENELSKTSVSNANVTGFNFGVPMWDRYGLTLIMGFNPYSLTQYKFSGNVNDPEQPYVATFAGMGGLSRLNFGLAGRPVDFINLGFEYNYAFGNIKNLTFFNFNNQNNTNTYIRSENDLKGSYVKGGIVLDLGKLIKNNSVFENLTIGGFYQNKFNLNSTIDEIYQTSLSNSDTANVFKGDWSVPEAYGFGITKQIGKQLIVSSDISFQKWSSFKPETLIPVEYTDNFRYGAGFEVLPAVKKDRNWLESMTYRAGFSYDKEYFKIGGEDINHYSVSFGVGIPINNENGIDIGLEMGTRGKKESGLVKDNYIKVSLGLNFGEFWFIRPKDDDR
ncbi:MAG: outer membrane protein transport protein [Bacteroidetes bacterium]|nr:outer membrane protein transport protein [Bacteroidota bacterium]